MVEQPCQSPISGPRGKRLLVPDRRVCGPFGLTISKCFQPIACCALTAAAALGTSALAQAPLDTDEQTIQDSEADPADDPEQTILVTGKRPLEPEALRKVIRSIAVRGRSARTPLARFQAPLCVFAAGLGQGVDDAMRLRVTQNASVAGVEVAESGCKPNAFVMVVAKPTRFLKELKTTRPELHTREVMREIIPQAQKGKPALFWAMDVTSPADGRPANATIAGVQGVANGPNPNESLPTFRVLGTSSRKINFSLDRAGAVVVFDAAKLKGMKLSQVADYATMRLLAHWRPDAASEEADGSTILDLFALGADRAPNHLTPIDRALLRGVYSMRPNARGTSLEQYALTAYEDAEKVECTQSREGNCPREP